LMKRQRGCLLRTRRNPRDDFPRRDPVRSGVSEDENSLFLRLATIRRGRDRILSQTDRAWNRPGPTVLIRTERIGSPGVSTMDQQNLSIFSPASPPAESIRVLSVLVFVITGLIFLV